MIFKTESIKSNSNSIVYCLVKQQIAVCCELWEEGHHMQNFTIGEALKKGLFEEIEERIIKHALDVIILKALKNGAHPLNPGSFPLFFGSNNSFRRKRV